MICYDYDHICIAIHGLSRLWSHLHYNACFVTIIITFFIWMHYLSRSGSHLHYNARFVTITHLHRSACFVKDFLFGLHISLTLLFSSTQLIRKEIWRFSGKPTTTKYSLSRHRVGRIKRKESAFEHAQNVRIHITLHVRSLIRAFALHWNFL